MISQDNKRLIIAEYIDHKNMSLPEFQEYLESKKLMISIMELKNILTDKRFIKKHFDEKSAMIINLAISSIDTGKSVIEEPPSNNISNNEFMNLSNLFYLILSNTDKSLESIVIYFNKNNPDIMVSVDDVIKLSLSNKVTSVLTKSEIEDLYNYLFINNYIGENDTFVINKKI